MVLTIKKRLLVLRSGSSSPLGSLPRRYLYLSGGPSWKTNRNFSGGLGGLPVCSKTWRQHMHIERMLRALCLWTVGKCLVELGKETAGLSPPGHNTCWEKSNSPIRGLFLCTSPPYFFAATAHFTTSWCTSFFCPSLSSPRLCRVQRSCHPNLTH